MRDAPKKISFFIVVGFCVIVVFFTRDIILKIRVNKSNEAQIEQKIYTNTTAGYQIRYPSDWWVEPISVAENGILHDSKTSVTIWGNDLPVNSRRYWLRVMVYDNPRGLSAQEWVDKIQKERIGSSAGSEPTGFKEMAEITLGLNRAVVIRNIQSPDIPYDSVFIANKNFVYELSHPSKNLPQDVGLSNPSENFYIAEGAIDTFRLSP